jgi:hypothetical protein
LGSTYLLSPRISDGCTLTASTSVSDASASNLQQARPNLVWQSTTTDPYLLLDGTIARSFNALFLGYLNGQSGDTFRLRGHTADSWGGATDYDSGSLPVWPAGADLAAYRYPHRWLLFSPVSALRYWRVDFDFAGNDDGFVRMGRLILADALELYQVARGWSGNISEPPVEVEDLSGEQAARPRRARRSVSVRWPDAGLTRAQGVALQELLLERGSAKDLAMVLADDHTYPMDVAYVGRVKQQVGIQHAPPRWRTTGFELTELTPTVMR